MDNTRYALRIAVGIMMLVLLLAGGADALTITVNASGGGDYARIQDAINNSNNGDMITVAPGIYYENVFLNKSVNMVGAGADVTTIYASDPDSHVLYVRTDGVNISGFTLTGGTGSTHPIDSAGIFLSRTNNTRIFDNNISNNFYGIYIFSGFNNNITHNFVRSNYYGIFLMFSSNNTIYDNFFNNYNNFGSSGNNIWNIMKQAGTNIAGGQNLGGNFWADLSGTGFSLTCEDDNLDGICDSPYILDANNTDYMPLAQITYPVHNLNKGTNYSTIQSAIDDADTGDEIHVDSGIYYENVNVNKQLILKGEEIGTGMTVVDAGKKGDAITLSADWITLEGFNATNASSWYSGIMINSNHSTVIDNDVSRNNQGIFLYYSNNNNISANNATNNGAGFFLYSSTNNTLHDNNACNNIYAIYLFSNTYDVPTSNNTIYNNFFNNINGLGLIGINNNFWNTTSNSGTNIIGGHNLGGNVWVNPEGTGFSQTCIDENGNGICDSPYILDANNIDFLPLTSPDLRLLPIRFINGTVIDSVNKTSMAGVTVSANSTLSTTTNTTGFYSFAVSDGTYDLSATYDVRYYTNITTVSTTGQAVVIQDIELIKKLTGNITGSVTS